MYVVCVRCLWLCCKGRTNIREEDDDWFLIYTRSADGEVPPLGMPFCHTVT